LETSLARYSCTVDIEILMKIYIHNGVEVEMRFASVTDESSRLFAVTLYSVPTHALLHPKSDLQSSIEQGHFCSQSLLSVAHIVCSTDLAPSNNELSIRYAFLPQSFNLLGLELTPIPNSRFQTLTASAATARIRCVSWLYL
jgi:hypothetical protein